MSVSPNDAPAVRRDQPAFALAEPEDAPAVHDLIVRAAEGLPAGHFVLNDLATIRRQMPSGFTVTASFGEGLAGVLHVYFPSPAPTWASASGDRYRQDQVALMDIAAVLPEFRGQGLMRSMLSVAEAHLRATQPTRVAWYGTVHPDNQASRRSFEGAGYTAAAQVSTYGGLPRLVMRKLVP